MPLVARKFVREMASFTASQIVLSSSARVVVAVSGGPDSSALLIAMCLAAEAGLLPRPVGVAHFHHGLRGADADADAACTGRLAAVRAALPCVIGLGMVGREPGKSPDEAARDARYAFLRQAAQDLDADIIATAHTLDDQAETVLGRVLRGTGLAGLAGIPGSRDLEPGLQVIRPLLSQTRKAVEAFCKQQGLDTRHDPDNDDDRYARSRLRKHMPMLAERFNPRLAASLGELARQASQDNDLLQSLASQLWRDTVRNLPNGNLRIEIPAVRAAHPALRSRVLLAAIRAMANQDAIGAAATSAFVNSIEHMITGGSRETHLPGGLRATVSGLVLTFSRNPPETPPPASPESFATELPVPGSAAVAALKLTVSTREWQPSDILQRDRHSSTIDIAYNATESNSEASAEALPTSLLVRSAVPGDRIAPLGMGGRSRAVRDILAEAGVPARERANAPLVVDTRTNEIIWIIGLVQSESTRVTPETSQVIRLLAEWNTEHL